MRPRFIVNPDLAAIHADETHVCATCTNVGDKKKEKQIGFCMLHRIMVPTTRPVVCQEYSPA
jgi:hypothetical protein